MKLKSRTWLALGLAALAAVQCANPGTPTGGPRDRRPPRVVQSRPAAGATGFTGKQITIQFDENIQVKDAQTKFVISPPLDKQPRVEGRGEMLRVDFGECELQPSTTYTLDFADCVSDLNEGNVLEGFTFTFSTGESTDSMMISGNIYNALTYEPVKGMNVVLHSNTNDTAFRRSAPVRIAKTNDRGRFAIKNIPDNRSYRIYGLDDQNKNYRFDQAAEMIAWLPDSFAPGMETRQLFDSVAVDSIMPDSTIMQVWKLQPRDTLVFTPDSLVFLAYTEDYYEQYITADDRPSRNKLRLIFNHSMQAAPRITFPNQDPDVSHALIESSAQHDTTTIWLTDTTIYHRDSVVVAVTYPVLDSLKQYVDQTDTLTLWHFDRTAVEKKDDKKKKNKKEESEKKTAPKLNINIPGSLHLYSDLSITSSTPFEIVDWQGIKLAHKVDTLYEPMNYTPIEDSLRLCYRAIRADWQPGQEYQLSIDSAAVVDIYGLACGQTERNIKVTQLSRYGTLYIDVDSVPAHGLLQLVRNEKVERQLALPANGKAAFRYITAGSYMLRILIDENDNGKHDLGNIEQGTLPEQLIYYMEKIEVRANWDIKIDFRTSDFTIDKYAHKFKIKNPVKRSGR